MSATVVVTPQADGRWRGWESLTGGSSGYEVIGDSFGATHDSDTTYLVLPRLVEPAGIASFDISFMAEGLIVESILLRVAGKKDTGIPNIEIGFAKGEDVAFHAAAWVPGAAYAVTTRTFAANPLTGWAAWADGDLSRLQACIRTKPLTIGKTRITLINAEITYRGATNAANRVLNPIMTGV